MTYELAKELKEAGFPQEDHHHGTDDFIGEEAGEMVAIPTLSELIEACGDGILLFKGHTWIAVRFNGCYGIYDDVGIPPYSGWIDDMFDNYSEGNTPEEAVAKLWLALNKK